MILEGWGTHFEDHCSRPTTHFTDEKTKAKRGEVTSPRSYSKLVTKLGPDPGDFQSAGPRAGLQSTGHGQGGWGTGAGNS